MTNDDVSRLADEAEAQDGCGLPDGAIHFHTGRCYRAGFHAGWAAAQSQDES